MFLIEALHPDGWRIQGRTAVEYWAQIEAQTRCCSDGRAYRVRDEDDEHMVSFVNTTCCRALVNSGN
jgi:allophanate hydrolase subunit 1